ncbi:MAG: hypothetical protein AAF982_11030, partial [Pseudomonadota bacterium]
IANMDWWNSVDPADQAMIEAGLMELEGRMFALAATETADGLSCNTGGVCPYGEPAGMTLVPVSAADIALREEAANVAVLPAYKERCGDACAVAWNATIGKAMGFAIK